MTRPKLTGLGIRAHTGPVDHRCSCGCGAWGSFGFPGELWFAQVACIPADLQRTRFGASLPRAEHAGAVAPAARPADLFGAPPPHQRSSA